MEVADTDLGDPTILAKGTFNLLAAQSALTVAFGGILQSYAVADHQNHRQRSYAQNGALVSETYHGTSGIVVNSTNRYFGVTSAVDSPVEWALGSGTIKTLFTRQASRIRFSGVYDIQVSGPLYNGQYIGHSDDIVRRFTQHFERSRGKFYNHSYTINKYYAMPNSTLTQREILEDFLIREKGLPNLLNDKFPISSERRKLLFRGFY